MISKIGVIPNSNQRPSFKAKPAIVKSNHTVLQGAAAQQVASLKSVCKEILLKTNNNKKLIPATVAALGGIKLTETAITLYENEKDAVRLSMPKGVQGDLFKMQVIKDEKPVNSVMVDNFNRLVESFSLNKVHYLEEKNADKDLINAVVEGVFKAVDEPLFQVRKFIRKNAETSEQPVQKLTPITLPKPEEIKEQKFVANKLAERSKIFIPKAEEMANYSMTELLKQQADKTPRKKHRVEKNRNNRLIPVNRLSPSERAELLKANVVKQENTSISSDRKSETGGIINANNKATKIEEKRGEQQVKITQEIPLITAPKRRGRLPKVEQEIVPTTVAKRRGRPPKIKQEGIPAIAPKRRGRPPKSKVKDITVTEIKKVEKLKQPQQKPADGIIPADLKLKVEEIFNLNKVIFDKLNSFSRMTAMAIRSGYNGIKTGRNKMSFGDLIIATPQRKDYAGHEILSITNTAKSESLNISDSEKIIKNKINWDKGGVSQKLKFLNQEEVDSKTSDIDFNKLIDDAITNLKAFKEFLDSKGWHKSKQKINKTKQISNNAISSSSFTRLQNLIEKNNNIKAILSSIPYSKAKEVKQDFGQVSIIQNSLRTEFINPLGDESNISFHTSKTRLGENTFIIKHKNNIDLEEVFVISNDGKIMKNVNRHAGINLVLPTNKARTAKFYSQEELEQNDLQSRLENLLTVLENKMNEYEQFLKNYEYKETEPKVKTIKKSSGINKKDGLPLLAVKDFIDNFVRNLQEKAEEFTKITGYKSSLDSVAKDLKTKFEEFLKKEEK
ncbi:MAG: hypothetical protein E7Z89_05115 [Cyanobacteria bacterium SIG28]|nr:hypothetical protein [Cyanobacteria bacterium SIG28]